MVHLEMLLQRVIIGIVLLLSALIATIANMTSLMLVSAVSVELVVTVESLTAETTFWVAPEATLIHRARVIVTKFLMLP